MRVLFHQGARRLGEELGSAAGRAELAAIAATELSAAGQRQVETALSMLSASETQLGLLRGELVTAARRLNGAKVLSMRLYGVGPITALALTCWLGGAGRFGGVTWSV